MKLPPGYGQIVKLSGKRRRPYAVRVDAGMEETEPGHFVRKQKYLEYFEKRTEALEWLAKYNAGIDIGRRPSVADMPSFADVYVDFMAWYDARHPGASDSARRAYSTAYKHAHSLHSRKFISIRTADMQDVMAEHADKSQSTAGGLLKLFHGMYRYALTNEIAEKDYSQFVFSQGRDPGEPMHKPFTPEEIRALWEAEAYPVLIMIYTGIRVGELLRIECADIDLEACTMTGGIKTKAGKDRTIPIHRDILPLIRDMMGGRYLFGGDNVVSYHKFLWNYWSPWMEQAGLDHRPHDTRHTAASMMEQAGIPLYHQKLILGHAINDITQGIYTHITSETLVSDINLLPSYKR